MLLQEAKNKLTRSNNRSLINFIQQRQCQNYETGTDMSELLKIAYQEVQKRQAQEFKALFSGQPSKDEPIQNIIDEINNS
jgi:hypothetical protein|tara:strand:- start:73 stop:312 length:240 start_codon:yes stop_codon:yes gene_type:complete